MKSIEDQARAFSKFDSATDIGTDLGSYRQGLFEGFLAGYKAAQDQVADASKVIAEDSCEHILDMEKMVDVNSSNNSNGWISVKERLPDNALEVIAISNGKSTAFLHKLAYCRWIINETITHWMPLPEAPKEEK